MRTALVIALLLNVPLVLSACANTMDNQASKAPLSRHDRLWNSHLKGW